MQAPRVCWSGVPLAQPACAPLAQALEKRVRAEEKRKPLTLRAALCAVRFDIRGAWRGPHGSRETRHGHDWLTHFVQKKKKDKKRAGAPQPPGEGEEREQKRPGTYPHGEAVIFFFFLIEPSSW